MSDESREKYQILVCSFDLPLAENRPICCKLASTRNH